MGRKRKCEGDLEGKSKMKSKCILWMLPLDLVGVSDQGKGKIWSLQPLQAGWLHAPTAQSASRTGKLLLCKQPKKDKGIIGLNI